MKNIVTIIFALLNFIVFAQIQQGIVKTRGRLDVHGNLIHGVYLSGATIEVKDCGTHTSDTMGQFSFAVPNKLFYLTDVKKNEYKLCDQDILSKCHSYSSSPLIVVMDTPNQQLEDRLASEEKIRAKLTAQLNRQRAELEKLKKQQIIDEEKYKKQLLELFADQNSNEKLISEMAERYSKLDFDGMNEFRRQIAFFIQNGELTRADSLIKTQGTMEEQEAELDRLHEANVETRENLANSEKMEDIKLKEFQENCYSCFVICKLQNQNDSAAYWLKKRLSKDTTNIDAVWDYAKFCDDQRKYNESIRYYKMCKNIIYSKDDSIIQTYYSTLANIHSNIGKVYAEQKKYLIEAEDELKKSLELRYTCLKSHNRRSDCFNLVRTLTVLGQLYLMQGKSDMAEEQLKKALNLARNFTELDTNELESLVSCLHFVAVMNIQSFDFEKAESNAKEAMEVSRQLFDMNHDLYGDKYALSLSQFALSMSLNHHEELVEKYCNDALITAQNLAQKNPERHTVVLAITQFQTGLSYYNIQKYDLAKKSLNDAIKIYHDLNETAPNIYNYELINCLELLGSVYDLKNMHEQAENCFQKEFELSASILNKEEDVFNQQFSSLGIYRSITNLFGSNCLIALTYLEIGKNREEEGEYELAEKYYLLAIDCFLQNTEFKKYSIKFQDEYYLELAEIYRKIANLYDNQNKLEQAEEYYKKYLDIVNQLVKDNPELYEKSLAYCLYNIGNFYYRNDKLDLAEYYYPQATAICESLSKEEASKYNASLALMFYRLGIIYGKTQKKEQSEENLLKALSIYQVLAENDPDSFLEDLALNLRNLEKIFKLKFEFEQARKYKEQMIYCLRKLAQTDLDQYNPILASELYDMVWFYGFEDEEKSKALLDEVESIYRDIIKSNPNKYYSKLAETLCLQGRYCDDNEKSEKYYLESVSIYRRLVQEDTTLYSKLADNLMELGKLHWLQDEVDNAEMYFEESMNIYKMVINTNSFEELEQLQFASCVGKLVALSYYIQNMNETGNNKSSYYKDFYENSNLPNPDNYDIEDFAISDLASIYFKKKSYDLAYKYQKESLKNAELKNTEDNNIYNIVSRMGELSFYSMYCRKYSEAEFYAKKALEMDPSKNWIKTNLCTAILFQGRYDEAERLAKEIKDVEWILYNTTLGNSILNDLEEFEKNNLIPEDRYQDVRRIRAFLMQ